MESTASVRWRMRMFSIKNRLSSPLPHSRSTRTSKLRASLSQKWFCPSMSHQLLELLFSSSNLKMFYFRSEESSNAREHFVLDFHLKDSIGNQLISLSAKIPQTDDDSLIFEPLFKYPYRLTRNKTYQICVSVNQRTRFLLGKVRSIKTLHDTFLSSF